MKEIKSISDLERKFGKEKRPKKDLNLKNIRKYLSFFNHPEKKLKTVQIAGTNGKGSTAATLQSLFTKHHLRAGLYTSPHLISYQERIRIGDERIKEKKLLFLVNKIYKNSIKHSLPLTLFEVLTIAAILCFLDEKTDIAIFETGLGGRLDATNILNSKIQVITDISKDHTEFLGSTNKKIAHEKAGIIKNESIVITSNTNKEILKEIRKKIINTNSKLIRIRKKNFKEINISLKGTVFDFNSTSFLIKKLKTNLIGFHQTRNTALALVAFINTIEKYSLPVRPNFEKIREALLKVDWPGRFEIIRNNPLLIIDGAHNVGGIKSLIQTIKNLKLQNIQIFFAAKKDKDVISELKLLKNLKNIEKIKLVKTGIDNMYQPKINLNKVSRKIGNQQISMSFLAKQIKKNKKNPIVITGSLYFLGAFLKKYRVIQR